MGPWIALGVAVLAVGPAEGAEGMDAGHLQIELSRLESTGRVLYVAAHPDDENTRLLAYLANARHFEVAYLSLTRGGGGQNLIGPEQGDLLGVIRTQELLAARRLDGARQFFTRARDFGYSKSAEEALGQWGKEAVLGDVVWAIRRFRPDVIITRFTEDPPNHGHHTASAILAREAFSAAADPARFPEQLKLGVGAWQATRLVQNVPRWGAKPDDVPQGALPLDVGGYDARLGQSYGELAAASRTMHKSQGFGSAGQRGPILEYFQHLVGAPAKDDLLDGVDTTWTRFEGTEALTWALGTARHQAQDVAHPERAVATLLDAHQALAALARRYPVPRVLDAQARLSEVILSAAGVFARVTADAPEAAPGGKLEATAELLLRASAAPSKVTVGWPGAPAASANLTIGAPQEVKATLPIPPRAPVSAPYWLAQASRQALLPVTDPRLIGDPEGPPPLEVTLTFHAGSHAITVRRPVLYVVTDRVLGERPQPVQVVPPLTVTPLRGAVMLPNGKSQPVQLQVRAGADGVSGALRLEVPKGWRVSPAQARVTLAKRGQEQAVVFQVTPPAGATEAVEATPVAEVDGAAYSWRRDVIDHPHIPVQVILQPARVRLAPLELRVPKGRVGYIAGSGDTVAEDLRQVGLQVDELDDETLRQGDFRRFSAIVIGIRAYNTRDALAVAQPGLLAWVKAGGTLLAQYNTSTPWQPLPVQVGPYPLTIGRGRVTDETAAITWLDPKHPAATTPHRLGPADFEGWVQERGLYFAERWEAPLQPLLRMQDPDEAPQEGSLLVGKYGKGTFIYTGLAFFRQLPAGVPGGYRLLVNLLEL
ncbi:MAG: PIG-L family deacetylase [Deltaproteobacteria bacterium]|nr:PIG-L family deacetylase [Deltaproteobacteria bacterium]